MTGARADTPVAVAADDPADEELIFGAPKCLWDQGIFHLIVRKSVIPEVNSPNLPEVEALADAGDVRARELLAMHYYVLYSDYFRPFDRAGDTRYSDFEKREVKATAFTLKRLQAEQAAYKARYHQELDALAQTGDQPARFIRAKLRGEKYPELAGDWLELINEGYAPAIREFAMFEERELALQLWEKAASAGDPLSMARLALRAMGPPHFRPWDEPKDLALGKIWLDRYDAAHVDPSLRAEMADFVRGAHREIEANGQLTPLRIGPAVGGGAPAGGAAPANPVARCTTSTQCVQSPDGTNICRDVQVCE